MKQGALPSSWRSRFVSLSGRILALLAMTAAAAAAFVDSTRATAEESRTRQRVGAKCGPEMVRVDDYCVDRWEIATVDNTSGKPLSPYYPPHPRRMAQALRLWQTERLLVGNEAARSMPLPSLSAFQRAGKFEPRAVSQPGVIPQGYLSYGDAKLACENAGKRLCTEEEWVRACQGRLQRKFPYGNEYQPERCNVHRAYHPAHMLHGYSFVGHTDPRLNLLSERGVDPLLRATGATTSCVSRWQAGEIYDMAGNLDEWVEDPDGVFVGGFYARSTKQGCESKISSHSTLYYDYSLGTRCCVSTSATRATTGD